MADATLLGQIIVGGVALLPYTGIFFQIRSARIAAEARVAARDKEIDGAILKVSTDAASALTAFKDSVTASFKEVNKATGDFMPKTDIIRELTVTRGDVDRLSLMVIDVKLQVGKNEQRIADTSNTIAEVKADLTAMRHENAEGFQRMNDSITQIVRAAK